MRMKAVLFVVLLCACIIPALGYYEEYDTGDCSPYTTTAGEWNDNGYDYYPENGPLDGDFEWSVDIDYNDGVPDAHRMIRMELNGITAPYYWVLLFHDDTLHSIQYASDYTEAYTDGTGFHHTIKVVRVGTTVNVYKDDIFMDSCTFGSTFNFLRVNALTHDTKSYDTVVFSNMHILYGPIEAMIEPNQDSGYSPLTVNFQDYSLGFFALDPYTLNFDDGYYSSGYWQSDIMFSHTYYEPGTYNVSYSITRDTDVYNDTCEIEVLSESTCNYAVDVSASKTTMINPLSEYITISASLSGDYALTTGSTISYMFKKLYGSSESNTAFATFTNTTGGWYYSRNDLGITTSGFTTYADIFSEFVRFTDSGYYQIRVAVNPSDNCMKYDDIQVYVSPSSQVNLDIWFKDGVTLNNLDYVTAAISIVNVTGNSTYTGNPIGIATQIGQNVSIYAVKSGYETKHIYYTIPSYVYGNTLDIPFYMFPTDYGTWHPDNTTWTVYVKSASTHEPIYGASVGAFDSTGTIDSDYTNSEGYTQLLIPYRPGSVGLAISAIPYTSQTSWYNLGNATTYDTTIYMAYSGTPTPTPSYNYTFTVTPTSTAVTTLPTSSVMQKYQCTFDVHSASTGLPINNAIIRLYLGSKDDVNYKGQQIYSATTDATGRTSPIQLEEDMAYWVDASATNYYSLSKQFRMPPYNCFVGIGLNPQSPGVTTITTQPTVVLPTPSGTGIQGGFIGWIVDYFMEWFGCDIATARILLGLFMVMCGAVFVGGALAGFGGGSGAATGALIGGIITFIMVCYMQLLPFWLIPVAIGLVGMSFFIWRRNDGD